MLVVVLMTTTAGAILRHKPTVPMRGVRGVSQRTEASVSSSDGPQRTTANPHQAYSEVITAIVALVSTKE